MFAALAICLAVVVAKLWQEWTHGRGADGGGGGVVQESSRSPDDLSDWQMWLLGAAAAFLVLSLGINCAESCHRRLRRDGPILEDRSAPTLATHTAKVLMLAALATCLAVVVAKLWQEWTHGRGADDGGDVVQESSWPPDDNQGDWQILVLYAVVVLFGSFFLCTLCTNYFRPRRRIDGPILATQTPLHASVAGFQQHWPQHQQQQAVAPDILGAMQTNDEARRMAMSKMLEMGFDEDRSRCALVEQGWDVSRAVAALSEAMSKMLEMGFDEDRSLCALVEQGGT